MYIVCRFRVSWSVYDESSDITTHFPTTVHGQSLHIALPAMLNFLSQFVRYIEKKAVLLVTAIFLLCPYLWHVRLLYVCITTMPTLSGDEAGQWGDCGFSREPLLSLQRVHVCEGRKPLRNLQPDRIDTPSKKLCLLGECAHFQVCLVIMIREKGLYCCSLVCIV